LAWEDCGVDDGSLVIGVVDDHRAISAGVPAGLSGLVPPGTRFVEQTDVAGLLGLGQRFGVVLLDVRLADGSDPEDNVRRLCGRGWPVLLYTQVQQPGLLARCLRAGALGVVGKHQDWQVLARAVRAVAARRPFLNAGWAAAMEAASGSRVPVLTPREAEVLRLYAAGLPLRAVAEHVGIGDETAKEYLARVRRKYDDAGRPARTKTHLYRRAVEDGLIFFDEEQ
jgi:DNA-binding NarL/FixJ family response regulator